MQHNPVINQIPIPQPDEHDQPVLNQPQPLPEDPPLNLAVTEEEKTRKMLDEVRKN